MAISWRLLTKDHLFFKGQNEDNISNRWIRFMTGYSLLCIFGDSIQTRPGYLSLVTCKTSFSSEGRRRICALRLCCDLYLMRRILLRRNMIVTGIFCSVRCFVWIISMQSIDTICICSHQIWFQRNLLLLLKYYLLFSLFLIDFSFLNTKYIFPAYSCFCQRIF